MCHVRNVRHINFIALHLLFVQHLYAREVDGVGVLLQEGFLFRGQVGVAQLLVDLGQGRPEDVVVVAHVLEQ